MVEVRKSQSLFFPQFGLASDFVQSLCVTPVPAKFSFSFNIKHQKLSSMELNSSSRLQWKGWSLLELKQGVFCLCTPRLPTARLTERWLVRILTKHCWFRILLENLFTFLKWKKSEEISFQGRKWFTNLGVLRLHPKAVLCILLVLQ